MVEYEKKIMLTADEYNAIVMHAQKTNPAKKQVNYYFDTNDLAMLKKGITCRIREKDGKYKATIKYHDTEHPDFSTEEDLVEKSEFDPQIFNAIGLRYQGMLVTERTIIHKDTFCEMVLDRNVYLEHTDFELEVEYYKDSEHRAQTLIENIAECLVAVKQLTGVDEFVARIGQGGSKSQRFFERLKI